MKDWGAENTVGRAAETVIIGPLLVLPPLASIGTAVLLLVAPGSWGSWICCPQ